MDVKGHTSSAPYATESSFLDAAKRDRPDRGPPCCFATSEDSMHAVDGATFQELYWTSTNQGEMFDHPSWPRPSDDWADLRRTVDVAPRNRYVMPPKTPPWSPKPCLYRQVYGPPSKRHYEQSQASAKEVRDRMMKSHMPFYHQIDWVTTQSHAWTTARKNLNEFRKPAPPPMPQLVRSASVSGSNAPSRESTPRSCARSASHIPQKSSSTKSLPGVVLDVKTQPHRLLWNTPDIKKFCVNSVLGNIKQLIKDREKAAPGEKTRRVRLSRKDRCSESPSRRSHE
eukprot:GEMP01051599.1.p1 GENE.GEMP01051599.1~~GEMP01051599.1.p1  ORF type:complete len:284 (+),score=55.80 GEMP01051599.1:151-1002(+)